MTITMKWPLHSTVGHTMTSVLSNAFVMVLGKSAFSLLFAGHASVTLLKLILLNKTTQRHVQVERSYHARCQVDIFGTFICTVYTPCIVKRTRKLRDLV